MILTHNVNYHPKTVQLINCQNFDVIQERIQDFSKEGVHIVFLFFTEYQLYLKAARSSQELGGEGEGGGGGVRTPLPSP